MNCEIDSCDKEASHTFVWPWGTPSACCTRHIVVVQQKARAARGRMGQVNFVALDPGRPVEITRDERVSLHSQRLAAEAERDDARRRAENLFQANTKQGQELQQARARCAQLEAQLKKQVAETDAALRDRDDALLKCDQLREAGERLGVVLEPATSDTDRATPPDPIRPPGHERAPGSLHFPGQPLPKP